MRSTTRMRLEDCSAVSRGMVRFYVTTEDRRMVSVLGRRVDVAPHITSATFAVHQSIGVPGGWSVSDTTSGARAGFLSRTAEDAIESARRQLATRTDDDMARARARVQQRMAGAES